MLWFLECPSHLNVTNQRNQPCDYSVRDFSHVSAQPLGGGGELEIGFNHIANDSINYACVMKP